MFDPLNEDIAETGRRLGHDLYRFGRPARFAAVSDSVREGYAAAQARRVPRRTADRFERKWLQLRTQALVRGRVVDSSVTPGFLREIDVERCPITRQLLSHGTRAETDWSIDRINNDGAYVANNLAVMSVRANRAKGARGFGEVHALAQQGVACDGLTAIEWLRLAALMLGPGHATRSAAAPVIPMPITLPPRSACNAMQLAQHVFAASCRSQAGKNALVRQLKVAAPDAHAAMLLARLAEAIHQGLKGCEIDCDVWLDPRAMARLKAWRDGLDDRQWTASTHTIRAIVGARPVPAERIRRWQLAGRGYHVVGVQAVGCPA